MILQDDRLATPQMLRDALPFLAVQHHPAELRVHRMALVEAQRVLRHHVQLAAEDGERLAVDPTKPSSANVFRTSLATRDDAAR